MVIRNNIHKTRRLAKQDALFIYRVYPEAIAMRMQRTLQNLRQIADFVKSKRPRFEDLQNGLVTSFFVDPE